MGQTKDEITLEDLLRKGIIYERDDQFETSIFCGVYDQAKKMVQTIVQDNRKIREDKSLSRKQVEISNVISFIGRRGTGKTSSMLSFCKALKEYSSGRDYYGNKGLQFDATVDMENVHFCMLDSIDASLMESWERVIPSILAGMLNQLEITMENRVDFEEYSYRKLLQKLGQVYEDFMTLTGDQRRKEEYSPYEQLRNIASSQRIRREFIELVDQYLQYLGEVESNSRYISKNESYLVIAIDDLDMSYYNNSPNSRSVNNKSYEIMRDIDEYLSIPGVIVVASYNHDNLYQQCEKFFNISNDSKEDKKRLQSTNRDLANDYIASQYMQKVFSPNLRVYMPSWKKRDYEFLKILVNENGKYGKIFQRYAAKYKNIFNVKQLMLILHAEMAGIYYDCEGEKLHFLEPDNLRTLSTQLQMLLQENKQIIMDDSVDNSIFNVKNDVYFRFVQEKLENPEEKNLFDRWLSFPIERRSREIVSELCEKTHKLGKNTKRNVSYVKQKQEGLINDLHLTNSARDFDLIIERLVDNSGVHYSYAELIHSIYHMTRSKTKYSKELVECILYSYNVHLQEVYKSYRDQMRDNYQSEGKIKQRLIKEYKIFKRLMGESICGNWTEYYFPEIRKKDRNNTVILGCCDVPKECIFELTFYFNAIGKETLEKKIKEVLFVAMLYPDVFDWNEENIRVEFLKEEACRISLHWKEDHRLELTSCFKYTFLYKEYLEKMKELLQNIIIPENGNEGVYKGPKERFSDQIDEIIGKMQQSYDEWSLKYGNFMLPFYNLDITYNLVKRMFLENRYSEEVLEIETARDTGETFMKAFSAMLDKFLSHLKVIDNYYCLNGMDESFAKRFQECPFMELLNDMKQDSEAHTDIGLYVKSIVEAVSDDLQNEIAADDLNWSRE